MSLYQKKVDIIYNTTLICPWDCDVCCVDAVHVKKNGKSITLRAEGLTVSETLALDKKHGSIYDQAVAHRQNSGKELRQIEKKRIIDNLSGFDARIDISGGDALSVTENFELLQYAASRLGKDNVSLTVTGTGSSRYPAKIIAPHICEYNFTFDAESLADVALRPEGYAAGNLKKAKAFVAVGIPTRAEAPLTKAILTKTHLRRLYMTLRSANIDKLLVMRLFPVGRGSMHEDEIPAPDEYRRAIELLKELELELGGPIVKVQCALKHLVRIPSNSGGNPCDMVSESFGLMADGTLLASPWAIGPSGKALSSEWILGNLVDHSLDEILKSPQAIKYQKRCNENYGHCKIFSYLNSKLENSFDRIFDKADPILE